MKDFDSERVTTSKEAREFQIRGEKFVRREAVRPEATADFEDLKPDSGAHRTLEIIDKLICDFIEDDGAHDRYRTLRQREDNPITLDDLLQVANWVTGEVAGRPTGSPSDSSTGSEGPTTGTPLTDVSSSPEALVSAA